MSADDGFRPLADPRYFDVHPDDDPDAGRDEHRGEWYGSSPDRSPSHKPCVPSPPGFLRVAGGLLLIAIGFEFLMERILPVRFEVTTLVIGLLLLSWWARTTQRWAYVVGVIVTGIGIGSFLGGLIGGPVGGLLGSLATAGGFAVLAMRPPHMTWAWFPAGFIALTAVAGFGITLATAVFSSSSSVLLPASLVVAGGVLLARDALPRTLRTALLIACAVVFVMAGSARATETVTPFGELFGSGFRQTQTMSLPALEGRRLVVESGSGDITLRTGEVPEVELPANRSIRIDESVEGQLVIADLGSTRVTVTVPVGAKVDLRTASGDIDVRSLVWREGADLDIRTGSGDVDVEIAGDPSVAVTTGSGEVELDGDDHDDGVDVRDKGSDSGWVTVDTGSGDIEIDRSR